MVERSMRKQNWFWIGHDVIKKYGRELGADGIAVYNCLCLCASRDQICFPAQETISMWTGLWIKTVRKCIKNLESLGLLEKQKQGRKTVYLLTEPEDRGAKPPISDRSIGVEKAPNRGAKPPMNRGAKPPTNNNHITKTNNNILRTQPSVVNTPTLLTLFYKQYEEKHGILYPNQNYAKHGSLLRKPNESVGGEKIEQAIRYYFSKWKNHNFEQFIYKLPEILPKCADRPDTKVDEFAAYRTSEKTGD